MSGKKEWKFFLPHPNKMIQDMLYEAGHWTTDDIDTDHDAVLYDGGPDVCPYLYGEEKLARTFPDLAKERENIRVFKNTPTLKPKIGICYGGQFLNVMSGGSMWQDVDNHTADHEIDIIKVGKIQVTSTHHQMMIPGMDALVIAVANKARTFQSDRRVINVPSNYDKWDDPEVIYYSHTNSLCFQPHPEYFKGDCRDFFFELLEHSVFNPDIR